jgi:hypothetical protein
VVFENMQHRLSLIVDNEVNTAFIKANGALLNKFKVNSADELIKLWKTEYNIDLVLPEYLVFDTKTDSTMFLIKWS